MTPRTRWLMGLLAALYITMLLWTERTGARTEQLFDLLTSLAAAAVSVAVGWYLAGKLTKDADRRGIITLVIGMWAPLSATAQLMLAFKVHKVFQSSLLAAATWTAFCALLVLLLARGKASLAFTTRMLTFATAFLVVTQAMRMITMARAGGVAPEVVDARPPGVPDVYVIVLDKYVSGAWLRHTYGVDQTPFEDSLRALGFAVPRAARANYAHTHLALASFLNGRYLDPATDGVGEAPFGQTLDLVGNARTWSTFKARGYRIYTFPTWYSATSGGLAGADVLLRWRGPPRTQVAETWWINGPVAPLLDNGCRPPSCRPRAAMPYPIETLEEQEWKLAQLAELPRRPGPVLAFLHLLLPHEPYLFADDCTPVEPWWPPSDQGDAYEEVGRAYGANVRCLAPRLLTTIRTIIERSEVPPVFVLQSDHGHGRIFTNLLRGFTLPFDDLGPLRVGERFGIFAAYRFPGADSLVPDDVSPVNVMPMVEHALWRTPFTRQPDRSWWSTYQESFEFTEIPAAQTVPPSPR